MPALGSVRGRGFYRLLLANLGLLALFAWAMTETVRLRIDVVDGVCTAVLGDRTNAVPCPGIEGGQIGLYNIAADDDPLLIARNPWRQIMPDSSWRALTVASPDGAADGADDGSVAIQLLGAGHAADPSDQRGQWRTVAGELQPSSKLAVMQWVNPMPADFVLEAGLRRPVDPAGLLLLRPGGDDGWLFLYNSSARLGTWWRWSDGRPAEPLLGGPFQKSLTAQVQSLARLILLGHQAGLLLLLASWLLARLLAWLARRLGRSPDPTTRPGASKPSTGLVGKGRRAIMIALFLWVFAWSMIIASDLLGGIPHVQDSITYRFQAQTLARGHLTAPAPPEPAAFEQEFMLVREGRWFGKYPPGYPLLLAAGELAGLPWLVNPLLATLSVALLFVLGKTWFGRPTGLLASLLAAVSPFFLIMSGTFMAHAAELFWVLAFMVAWSRIVRCPLLPSRARLAWLIGAGLALGMVFLTRQLTALAVAGPFALATTVARPGDVAWSRRIKELLALAAAAAPLAALLLLYQAVLTGDPLQDPRLLFWPYDHLGFGQDIGQGQNVVSYDTVQGKVILVWQHDPSQPPRGHSPARGVFNVERNWQHLQSHLFGWLPPLTLAFAWLVFVLGRTRRADWILLITALTLMLVYVFYWADGVIYGPRYFYAALPAFLLLVARGIRTAAALAGRWAVGLIVASFVAGGLLIYSPPVLEDLTQVNFVDGARLAAVETAIEGPALVIVSEQHGDWWEYGNYFAGNTPWLDGPIIYARDLGPAANGRLRAHYPDRIAYLLRDGRLQILPPTAR